MSKLTQDLRRIHQMIESGHFDFYEIINEGGKVVIPGKRNTRERPNRLSEWFEYVENRIITHLSPGKYIFRGYIDRAKTNWNDFTIKKEKTDVFQEAEVLPNNPVLVNSRGNANNVMTIEEYTRLRKEIAELTADKSVLEARILRLEGEKAALEEQVNELESELEESGDLDENGSIMSKISQGFESVKPIFEGVQDMFTQWQRIKERELNILEKGKKPGAPIRATGKITRMSKKSEIQPPQPKQEGPTVDQVIQYFDKQFDENPEQANQELEQLEKEKPEYYQAVVNALGLEDEGEE